MPLSDRNIVISPNRGLSTEPNIRFTGADASSSATIFLRVYNTGTVGTLSIEGNAGQLLSITDSFTGTIFSVNDVSGIPSIEVFDTGEVRLAQFGGFVNVANSTNATSTSTGILRVVGGVGIGRDVYIGGNLSVAGSILGSISNTATLVQTVARTNNASHFLTFVDSNNATASAESIYTTSSFVVNPATGNVGVGTSSPTQKLEVQGTILVNNEIQFTDNAVRLYRSGNDFRMRTGSIDRVTVTSAGNVGIGTFTATSLLHVSGDVRITGITTVTNSTNSTNATSGALQVTGGAGIGQNLYVGGNISLTSSANTVYTSKIQELQNNGLQLYVPYNSIIPRISFYGGIGSTLTIDTNALTFGPNQNSGYDLGTTVLPWGKAFINTATITSSLNATSTTTGALIITGGAGIGRDVWIGGSLNVAGSITGSISGNAATVSTIARTNNASHFITFVDTNNSSATAEPVYTTSTLVVNPATSNVGIGTASPTEKLEVNGSIYINAEGEGLIIDATGARRVGFMKLGGSEGVISRIANQDFGIVRSADSNIKNSSVTYDLYVDGSGNVGIGSTSLTSKFTVAGDVRISGITTVTNTTNATSTTTGALQVLGGASIGGNTFIHGNLNVGTSNTTSSITVFNTSTQAINVRSIAKFTSPDAASTITVRMLDIDALTFSGSAGQLFSLVDTFTGTIFAVNDISGIPSIEVYDTGLVSLAEFTGNVGVGTTSTNAKLDVNGTFRVSSTATLSSNVNATSTNTGALQVVGGAGIGRDVWIGGNLNVAGSILGYISNTATLVQTVARTNNASHFLTFVDSNNSSATAEAVYTTSTLVVNPATGNVGIGTDSPTAKLDINAGTTTNSATNSINVIQTWNNTIGSFTAIKLNVTDTASTTSSLLLDLQVNGTSQFKVRKDGRVDFKNSTAVDQNGTLFLGSGIAQTGGNFSAGVYTSSFHFRSNYPLTWSDTDANSSTIDLALHRDASATLAQRNGGNAQTFRVYNTFTNASNYERGKIEWTSNSLKIGTENSGTGVARNLELQTNGTTRITLNASNSTVNFAGDINASSGGVTIAGAGYYIWSGRGSVRAVSDGVYAWENSSGNDFGRFVFGGTTASYPALKRSGTSLEVRLADDTAYAPFVAGNVTVTGNLTVQGTTTIVDSTVTNVSDPIFLIGTTSSGGAHVTDDGKDRGIAFAWHNGTQARTGFFGFDRSTGYFTFISSASIVNEIVSPAGGSSKGAVDVNLAGGSSQALVYQSAADTTAFLAAGTSGQILRTNGTGSPPSWVNPTDIAAGQVNTIGTLTNASFFLTFVDTNNASATAEALYTTSSFTINPSTKAVAVGGQFDSVGTTYLATGVGGDVVAVGPSGNRIVFNSGGSIRTESAQDLSLYASTVGFGGLTIATAGGTVTINSNSNATSTTTGALRVAGGVGIGGSVFVGDTVNVSNSILTNRFVSSPYSIVAPLPLTNAGNGSLEPTAYQLAVTGNVYGAGVDPSGRFYYYARNDAVEQLAINQATGQLTSITSAIATGSNPRRLSIDPTGRFLYVANISSNTISQFSINSSTGALSSIATAISAGNGVFDIAVDPTGRFAYAVNISDNTVSQYSINQITGALTSITTAIATGTTPYSIAVEPTGRFVYIVNNTGNSVSRYTINQVTGALTYVADTATGAGTAPRQIVIDPTGRFLYVSNNGNGTLIKFSIDQTTGALTVIATIFVNDPRWMVIDPNGRYFYISNNSGNLIYIYRINQRSGFLFLQGSVPSISSAPDILSIDSTGKFLFAASESGAFQRVTTFIINDFSAGNASFAGTVTFVATNTSLSTITGAVVVAGGVGIGRNLFVGGNTNIAGITTVTNTTNASSTVTGALQIQGGVGIGGNLYVGGQLVSPSFRPAYTATFLVSESIASVGQSIFSVPGGYAPGKIQVFANGINLASNGDFTATDGVNVVVARPRAAGDIIKFMALSDSFASTSTSVFTAAEVAASTNGQTVYSINYTPGTAQVFLKGVLLNNSQYTATNGTTVTLTTGTGILTGDILRVISFNNYYVAGALPLTGGTVTGDVNVTGTLSEKGTSIRSLVAAMSIALGA